MGAWSSLLVKSNMRLAHHLLRHPSGVWHFRLTVPQDLRAALGLRIIKRSLRTRDPAAARAWAYIMGARYALAFAAARQEQGMSGKHWDDDAVAAMMRNINEAAPGGVSTWKVKGPGGFSIETDGTAADNAAAREVARDMFKQFAQTLPPTAPVVHSSPEVPQVRRKIAAGKAVRTWLVEIKASTLVKTHTIKAAAVNGFADHFGRERLLHEATWDDVHAWVGLLRESGLQDPTLVNKCSYLRGFFNWAALGGFYPEFAENKNPAMGHVVWRTREKQKRRALGFKAFTAEQIQTLYDPAALATLSEGARWGAVIGLYTGARVSEVGQLALSDFTTVDGVPCLTITDEGEAQSVKNHASLRTIPIHPDLIGLGLMERVGALRAAGEARLFPRVKLGAVNGQGQWLGKAFTRHWHAVGLKKPAKGKIGFHSLRKTAIQTMKAAKVPLEWRCAYVGHDLDEEHVEAYSGEYGPKEMLEAVVPGLGWNLNLDGLRRLLNSAA